MAGSNTWLRAAAISVTATLAASVSRVAAESRSDRPPSRSCRPGPAGNATGDQFKKNIAGLHGGDRHQGRGRGGQQRRRRQDLRGLRARGRGEGPRHPEPDAVQLRLAARTAWWSTSRSTSTTGASRTSSSRTHSTTGPTTTAPTASRSSASTGRSGTTWTCSRRPASPRSPPPFDDLVADSAKLRAAGIQPFALGGKRLDRRRTSSTWIGQQYVTPDKMARRVRQGRLWCDPDVVKGLDLFGGDARRGRLRRQRRRATTGDQMTNAYFNGRGGHDAVGLVGLHQRPCGHRERRRHQLAGFPVPQGRRLHQADGLPGPLGRLLPLEERREEDRRRQAVHEATCTRTEVLKSWVSDATQILDAKPEVVSGADVDERRS